MTTCYPLRLTFCRVLHMKRLAVYCNIALEITRACIKNETSPDVGLLTYSIVVNSDLAAARVIIKRDDTKSCASN